VTRDAIVIGAGANGLAAAACLAKAGRRVLVLERAAADADFPDPAWIPPEVARDLDLARHAVQVPRPDPWIVAPLPAGGRLDLFRDVARSADAIARLSQADARRWPEFCARMHRLAGFLSALYSAPAPAPTEDGLPGLLRLASLGRRFRALGKTGMVDLLRVLPMSAGELLDDWFESDILKGVLAAGAVTGICQGPRSAGTAFVMLHHHVGSPAGVFRRPAAGRSAFLAAARALGVEVQHGAEVGRIMARGSGEGRAAGVALVSGDEIAASMVLSSADPRRTFLQWLDPGALDPEFVRAVGHIKFRGVSGRVTLTLAEPPPFDTLCVSPSLEYLERAYDAAKYGRVSERPWIEARAAGRRVVLHVQYAPYQLRGGTWDAAHREALGDVAVRTLAEAVPGLERGITAREVLAPPDLEARLGVTEGHAYHGEMTLDQVLFMRPVPGWAHYRTPVPGLYLCGSGAHPGGGIAGGAGRLGALTALAE
jgi:phytoene dehydrogenase-like protein